ncbi:MAG: hypothetical protein H0X34_10600 [Chthoniobacterales bacterium]|nr:hypothetical protein [Chthoniobacterales bacterium]
MMKIDPPPKGKGRLGGTAPKTSLTLVQFYKHSRGLQAICEIQWRQESHRLAALYRQSGDPADLFAFRRHRAAMGGRMRLWTGGGK